MITLSGLKIKSNSQTFSKHLSKTSTNTCIKSNTANSLSASSITNTNVNVAYTLYYQILLSLPIYHMNVNKRLIFTYLYTTLLGGITQEQSSIKLQ